METNRSEKHNLALDEEIQTLIELKYEGDYWDFKEQWPHNNDLLHDIMCMANNLVNRDCYLIIGVDNCCNIVGVPEIERKNQQNLIDFLRDKPFAGGVRPTVCVRTIEICHKEIDIIIVKNSTNTPYFVTRSVCDIHYGAIYTRVGDTNTPINTTADMDKTIYLWEKRFGLLDNPLERMWMLLREKKAWAKCPDIRNDETIYYHIKHPEFNIVICDIEEDGRIDKPNNSFFYLLGATRALLHSRIWFKFLTIRYHNTVMYACDIVYSDEGNYRTTILEDEIFDTIRYKYNDRFRFDELLSTCEGVPLIIAYLIKDSEKYIINNLLNELYMSHKGKDDFRDVCEVVLEFASDEEQEEFFHMVKNRREEFINQNHKERVGVVSDEIAYDPYDVTMSLRAGRVLNSWLAKWRLKDGTNPEK